MSNKWRGLHGPITAAVAENEPEHERIFGSSYDARQRLIRARAQLSGINRDRFSPWKKPKIERQATA